MPNPHSRDSPLLGEGGARRRTMGTGGIILTVCATAAFVALTIPGQRAVLATKYTMSGNVDVPLHPPGMPYLKAPPMGDVEVTDEKGNGIGHVNFKTESAPPPPPPTIIKFGDVGVAPAGCPMCPVLDPEAVEKMKADIKLNAYRLDRLKKMQQANEVKVEEDVESMKELKKVMSEKMFDVQQELKKQDIQLEQAMLAREAAVGPQGPRGPPGYDGTDGVPGVDGANGPEGSRGKSGTAGPMGLRGPQGPRGPIGEVGTQGGKGKPGKLGSVGPNGPKGVPGSVSKTLECGRIGGQMYQGVCLKSSMPQTNKDLVPEGCKPYTPGGDWGEKQFMELSQMFKSRSLSGSVDHGSDGGNCKNHQALMSFTQGQAPSKVWVNGGAFKFNPTGTGKTCKVYNGDTTVAVYACTV